MKPDETRDRLRQVRSVPTRFETRENEDGQLVISGYFSVFNSIYEIGPGMSESVAPGTFLNSLSGDVRALTNHDSTLVLGRTTAGTLKLREDDIGLWGDVIINPKDSDAVNTYERVKRGDVSQCSFGFRITKEDTEVREDGSIHWTIRDVELYEVSVCTFPAYEATNVQARSAQRAEIQEREFAAWKDSMMRRIESWH
jgi:hypothetical protein